MKRGRGADVGRILAMHRGEWVVIADDRAVSHSADPREAVEAVPHGAGDAALCFSTASDEEEIFI